MAEEKRRILIVDDDKGMARAIERILNNESKYVIDIAVDGFEGGQKIVASKPDLLILDVRMPWVNGVDLAGALHDDAASQDIKILIVTGEATPSDKEEFKGFGVTEIIEKPFDNKDLKASVEKLLKG